jgi:hypothetical protein
MRATALEFDADVRAIDGECTSRYSTGSPLRGYGRAHRCLDRDRGEDRQHCSEEQHADSAKPVLLGRQATTRRRPSVGRRAPLDQLVTKPPAA